jgi:uncharacterized membrane protein YhaH (DUF805 family)
MSDAWYYAHDNRKVGPVSFAQLNEALGARQNPKDILVWCARLPNWVRAQDVPELRGTLPPPLPPKNPATAGRVSGMRSEASRLFRFFFNFRGRASRKTFWKTYLIQFAIILLIFFVENVIIRYIYVSASDLPGARVVLDITLLLLQLLIWVIILAIPFIFIRRLHDLNLSGWWLLAMSVGAAIAIDVGIANDAAVATGTSISVLASLVGIIPGTAGENKFGPDPNSSFLSA